MDTFSNRAPTRSPLPRLRRKRTVLLGGLVPALGLALGLLTTGTVSAGPPPPSTTSGQSPAAIPASAPVPAPAPTPAPAAASTPAPVPDLIAGLDGDPYAGYVKFFIRNQGTGPAAPFRISVIGNKGSIFSFDDPGLAPGE